MTQSHFPLRLSLLLGLLLAGTSMLMAVQGPQGAGSGVDRVVSRAWWNQAATVEDLALTAEQRGQMDSLLRDHIAKVQAQRDVIRARQQGLAASLAGGKRTEVERDAQAAGEAGAEMVRAELDLKVEVLMLLDASQREAFLAANPGTLGQDWLRPHRRMRSRDRPTPPPAAEPAPTQ